MSTSSLRRQMKNIVHNYSEAEIKVREATSNDPWGPSSSLMSEIADLTYNVVAFSEIMSMIWKRLNDHGKNWRHVYKGRTLEGAAARFQKPVPGIVQRALQTEVLHGPFGTEPDLDQRWLPRAELSAGPPQAMTLMEYLIKTGSERVSQQCKENMYAVQTLKDFQYVDRDGKDQGVNVREKAKQLVALLRDEDRLREERAHALKTKEKLAQTATASSAAVGSGPPPEAEQAWPQSSGEEELQLQLALAMSKEEADQPPSCGPEDDVQLQLALSLSREEHDKERIRRGDDLRLQMAIEESKRETGGKEESSLMDLADVFTAPAPPASDPWGGPAPMAAAIPTAPPASDPWGGPPGPPAADPWGGPTPTPASGDPWRPAAPAGPSVDPWGGAPAPAAGEGPTPDPWGGSDAVGGFDPEPDEFSDFDRLRTTLPTSGSSTALVDPDSLVSRPGPAPPGSKAANPFLPSGAPATGPSVTNPFQPAPPATLTLNQLRLSPVPPAPGAPPTYISPLGGGPGLPPVMPPGPPAPNTNPFLL
ncbi:Epsin-1 [Tupaia chinensis]|uniref:Epsin-1 n=1 Tax=Tupaia chinensis TaxID=246437 RepID=L9KQL0_TUPCH|nr:Epsin-1 [Tupaia chinensis]